jgi:tetratricopeptide (TPR) repeat protein
MTLKKFTIFLFCLSLLGCKENERKSRSHLRYLELSNKAAELVPHIGIHDSSSKAVTLLDSATAIDSNHFLGYYNKLMFFDQLKQYDRSVSTINKLIQMRPYAYDLYFTGGMIYHKASDTAKSIDCFRKSLQICNIVLDTMKSRSLDYLTLVITKASVLKILRNNEDAELVLRKLQDSTNDAEVKEQVKMLRGKTREELLGE